MRTNWLKNIYKKLIYLTLATTLLSSTSWAATYYVDKNHPNASDVNIGTEDKPFITIQRGADKAIAGDIVYVKEAIYNEWVNVKNSGTAEKPITFIAYPNHKPVIDGTGIDVPSWYALFHSINKSYITLDGFEIRNSDECLIRLRQGDGFIVRNCKAHGNSNVRRSGIVIDHCNKALIENNESYNTGWNAFTAESTNNVIFKNNYAHDNPAHVGINIFPNTEEVQMLYRGNNVINNVVERCKVGIYMRWQADNKIIGNLVYNNGVTYEPYWDGNGQGLKLGFHETLGDKSYTSNTEIYNNTFVGNKCIGFKNQSAKNVKLFNNIFAFNDDAQIRFEPIVGISHELDFNNYYANNLAIIWNGNTFDSLSTFKASSGQEANGLNANPLFKDAQNDVYTLTQESRELIDSGKDLSAVGVTEDLTGTPRPIGNGLDIGAFEFIDSNLAKLSPPTGLTIK